VGSSISQQKPALLCGRLFHCCLDEPLYFFIENGPINEYFPSRDLKDLLVHNCRLHIEELSLVVDHDVLSQQISFVDFVFFLLYCFILCFCFVSFVVRLLKFALAHHKFKSPIVKNLENYLSSNVILVCLLIHFALASLHWKREWSSTSPSSSAWHARIRSIN
jgi:hypothetical protein